MSILVVGSINMDTTYLVPHIPVLGETIIASERHTSRGGKGQNQAVTIARLGGAVKMIGAVGNDESGELIQTALGADGVDTEYIYVKNEATGLANIYVDDAKNNNIVVYAGANFQLTTEDIQQASELFQEAKYCVLQMEVPLDVIYETLKLCQKHKVTTILNPAPANPSFNLEYLQYVDYLIPNETELELMTGKKLAENNLAEMAQDLLQFGCKYVIVTLGTEGSVLFGEMEEQKIPAVEVDAIDTTAAGDSYIGAFTTYLAEGKTTKEAMAFAAAVAAKAVTKLGAINSLPMREEVDEFISNLTLEI